MRQPELHLLTLHLHIRQHLWGGQWQREPELHLFALHLRTRLPLRQLTRWRFTSPRCIESALYQVGPALSERRADPISSTARSAGGVQQAAFEQRTVLELP